MNTEDNTKASGWLVNSTMSTTTKIMNPALNVSVEMITTKHNVTPISAPMLISTGFMRTTSHDMILRGQNETNLFGVSVF